MKRLARKAFITLSILVASTMALPASALTTRVADQVATAEDMMVSDVFLAAGSDLSLANTSKNDVLVAGGQVTIDGPVEGDVLVAGGQVTINGAIQGNIRAIGGGVTINGPVGKNVTALGGTVILGPNASVAGEFIVAGGDVTLNGAVTKSVSLWTGLAVINDRIGENLAIHTPDDCGDQPCISFGPNANIGGDFSYWASAEPRLATGATIAGKTTRHPAVAADRAFAFGQFVGMVRWWNLLSSMLVGIAIALLFPRLLRQSRDIMMARPWPRIGVGILVFLVAPVALFVLAITVIGIPLAVIVGGLYVLTLYLSQVFLGFAVGDWVLRRIQSQQHQPSSVLLGTIVGMSLIMIIFDLIGMNAAFGPLFGFILGLIRFGLLLWVLGSIATLVWQSRKKLA